MDVALKLRVVMILPQVHLRNGELLREVFGHAVESGDGIPPSNSPAAAFPPRHPLLDSAFAGGGLNIRHGELIATPQPLQSLDVRLLLKTLRCGLPIGASCGVVTIRGGVTLAAAPALARRPR